MDQYKVVYEGGEAEIVEKKSRFIASVQPIQSEEEALAFIHALKKKYWDASHNCSAFTVGKNHELTVLTTENHPKRQAGQCWKCCCVRIFIMRQLL